MNKGPFLFKIILVGNSGVGKTSMLKYFNNGETVFPEYNINAPTIGIDFITKTIHQDKKRIKLQIWDTSGQERFNCITTGYFKGANSCIFVFSLHDKVTFLAIEYWYHEYIKHNKAGTINNNLILVGAKHDLKREVTPDMIKELCDRYHFIYTETSAVSGVGIVELFQLISNMMVKQFIKDHGLDQEIDSDPIDNGGSILLNSSKNMKDKCCSGLNKSVEKSKLGVNNNKGKRPQTNSNNKIKQVTKKGAIYSNGISCREITNTDYN